jgi:hypothetical protein
MFRIAELYIVVSTSLAAQLIELPCVAPTVLSRAPYLQTNNGMKTRTKEIIAKRQLAHVVPSFSYICKVNRGKTAPSVYLDAPLAAIARSRHFVKPFVWGKQRLLT